jgi:hypothetical protein
MVASAPCRAACQNMVERRTNIFTMDDLEEIMGIQTVVKMSIALEKSLHGMAAIWCGVCEL